MCENLGDVPSEVASCLKDLAEVAQAGDIETFVADHAQKIVESISEVRVQAKLAPTSSAECGRACY